MPAITTASKPVPKVSFHHNNSGFELEIVDLKSIWQRSKTLSPSPERPHRIEFNLILVVERGNGHHLIDFEHIPYGQSNILFINKGQIQSFDFSTVPDGKAILYTAAFLDTLHSTVRLPFSLSASMPTVFFLI